jgi:predicted RNA-binding protein
MLRHSIAASVLLFVFAGGLLAADKEVKGTVVKVDLDKKTLTVKTEDGEKTYDINDDTKFLGPKGGVSKEGIKDDRLTKGAEVKLVIAGNNKTAREVHLPERKEKDKDK